jgi:Putative auto-transporter adhesin, head GIN domain
VRRAAPLLALVLLAGCGGGERIVETREVAPYDRLEVDDSIDVRVVPGDGREVRVRAGEKVIDRVTTESSGGILSLDVRDRGIVIGPDPLGDVRVEIAASALEGVKVDGASDVTLTDLEGEALELEIDGAADVEAFGAVDALTATIDGAGDADLAGLSARTARVVVRGAGNADLNVSEELDVTIEGAGDVTYRGDPRIRSDVEGAGDIRREGR